MLAVAGLGVLLAVLLPAVARTGTTSTDLTTTVKVAADARVEESNPTNNYGNRSTIDVDGGSDPDMEGYLRFDVPSLGGSVVKAELRLYSKSTTADGPAVYGVGSWSESSITWANRPSRSTGAVADAGSIGSGGWYSYDVTSLVGTGRAVSVGLIPTSSDSIAFASREGSPGAELVVTTRTTSSSTETTPTTTTPTTTTPTTTTPTTTTPTTTTPTTTTPTTTTPTTPTNTTPTTPTPTTTTPTTTEPTTTTPTTTTPTTTTPTTPTDTTAPTKPTGLKVTAATTTSATVSWQASTDDVGVAGYVVSRNGTTLTTLTGTAFSVTGLSCGTSYQIAVRAFDAEGNTSDAVAVTAKTTDCAPPSSCTKVASPGAGTAQALVASLASGETGCLRGGTYTATGSYVLDVSKSNVTITSYPGERARLVGIVQVRNGANGVHLSSLDFEGTGGANTVKVYAADFILERSDVTNKWRGLSCMMLGSNSAGEATRAIVRQNRFHECGDPARGSLDHGVYAANVLDGRITENLFYNMAAYSIQLYPNSRSTRVDHNVFDGGSSVRGGIVFGGDTSYASSNNVVENNIIAYAATYNITYSWGGAVGSGNIARNNCLYGAAAGDVRSPVGFTASGNVNADPQFVDRAGRNYRLKSGSACLGIVGYDIVSRIP